MLRWGFFLRCSITTFSWKSLYSSSCRSSLDRFCGERFMQGYENVMCVMHIRLSALNEPMHPASSLCSINIVYMVSFFHAVNGETLWSAVEGRHVSHRALEAASSLTLQSIYLSNRLYITEYQLAAIKTRRMPSRQWIYKTNQNFNHARPILSNSREYLASNVIILFFKFELRSSVYGLLYIISLATLHENNVHPTSR